jgi:ABC-type polysaccharide/polyol phosphate transport system ATPase subunit
VTIVLVSHALAFVEALCDGAILLERGEVVAAGRPDEVISIYRARVET